LSVERDKILLVTFNTDNQTQPRAEEIADTLFQRAERLIGENRVKPDVHAMLTTSCPSMREAIC